MTDDEKNNPADEPETVPPNAAEREAESLPEAEEAVAADEPSELASPEPEPQSVSILEPEPDIFTDIQPLAFTHSEPESVPEPESVVEPEPEVVALEAEEFSPVAAEVVHAEVVEDEPEPPADDEGAIDEGDIDEDAIAASEGEVAAVAVAEVAPPPPVVDEKKRWYIVKVQSGREESIKAALERRTRIEAMDHFVGQVVIPTEKVTVLKQVTERKKDKEGNYVKVKKEKRVIKEQKKFPGYLMAFVEYNNEVLSLFRETSGVGDFVGGSLTRAPIPMTDQEVQGMLAGMGDDEAAPDKVVVPTLKFGKGDRVKVRDGTFAGMEGEVKEIIEPKDAKETTRVKIVLMMWGRPLDVDLEHWQVDPV